MKIIVFGATGGTGIQVVEQALAQGHTVTAVARRPSAITIEHPKLKVMAGDVLEAATIAPLIAGHDVVVSSIGVNSSGPTRLYSAGTQNIIEAMQAARVCRFICVSASALEAGKGVPFWQKMLIKIVLQRILRESYADMTRMEAEVRDSGLDWTLIRAPRLTHKSHTGKYRVAINSHLTQIGISRADLADYIVNHLNDQKAYHAMVELAY